MGPGRRYFDVVIVKASYALAEGPLKPADAPAPIALADRWHDPDDATRSSLRVAGDAVLFKPATDVFVTGAAHAPSGQPTASWNAGVVVTGGWGSIRYGARVCGPRWWEHHRLRGWTTTPAEPARSVPIRYERSFGGAYEKDEQPEVHPDNPSGVGFLPSARMRRDQRYPAPQWTPPAQADPAPGEVTPLTGLGPVARPWRSRLKWAGTYDDAWLQRTRTEAQQGLPPDYPADFDPRFFQCAHPSLIAPGHLSGDERIGLVGLVEGRERLSFDLPGERLAAHIKGRFRKWRETDLRLDTVHIDLDHRRIDLTWRLTLDHASDVVGVVLFLKR